MMNAASKAGELLDTVALLFTESPTEPSSVAPTTGEPSAFSEATLQAMSRLVENALRDDPHPLTSRQFHMLFALAAADILTDHELAAFARGYVDPGVELWYSPVALQVLREALHNELAHHTTRTPLQLLEHLDRHTHEELLRWAPTTTPFSSDFLHHHATSAHELVRGHIALNPETRADTLTQLSDDTATYVAQAVARNERTREGTLVAMSHTSNDWVRAALATNAKTPPPILAELAEAPNARVRAAVVWNDQTPAETRALLELDPHPSVIDACFLVSRRAARQADPSAPTPVAVKTAPPSGMQASHHKDLRDRYRVALSDRGVAERVIVSPAILDLETRHPGLQDSLRDPKPQALDARGSS